MGHLRWKQLSTIVALIGVLLVLPAVGLAQDGDAKDPPGCNPVALQLAQEMGIDCQVLLDSQAAGFGLGEIMKSWHLSQQLSAVSDNWQALLQQKKEAGLGWGHFKMAYRTAGKEGDPQALLAWRQSGLGWGQIRQAQILDGESSAELESIIEMMQAGLGWGDIRAELGLPPGQPPWAGGGQDKGEHGPPPWAQGGGNNENKGGQGPPDWAGQGGRGTDTGEPAPDATGDVPEVLGEPPSTE